MKQQWYATFLVIVVPLLNGLSSERGLYLMIRTLQLQLVISLVVPG